MLSMDDVYREYAQTVYKYLLTLTHNDETAEELTQETFYQAVKSVKHFNGECKISTWLCSIAKNCYRSYLRKNPVTEELSADITLTSSDNSILEKESHIELLRRLHMLNEDMREVMYLRLFGDLSFREIGDILSKTENWARVNFYRGKEKLRKELEQNEK